MFKRFFTFSFVLFVFLSVSNLFAQQTLSSRYDLYTGKYVKTEIPAGQNIPTSYNTDAVLLYDNGPMITHPGAGAGGKDVSALQSAIGLSTYGFGAQISAGNSMADDFTINGSTWNIEEMRFFTYQTSSGLTSTINDLRIQIYNGQPNAGGVVIWGDMTTNRLTSTSWTNVYRTLDTDLLNGDRPIMVAVAAFSTPINLSPGTYWVEFSLGGTAASGPWATPVSIVGQAATGNALQKTSTGWAAALDGTYQQDVPFLIFGSSGAPCPVQTPVNPTPADNAMNVPVTGATLSWSNGGPGTIAPTQVEVKFGLQGNMATVYSGTPVTTWAIPGTLQYNKVYQWQVINKIDTCILASPTWKFTTAQNPNVLFEDNFTNFSQWTAVGPVGLTNWATNASANAGGTAPELRMSWTPSFTGESMIRSTVISAPNSTNLHFDFKLFLDWYANPSGVLTFSATYDGGATRTTLWTLENPTANVGPGDFSFDFTTPATEAANLQLELTYNGYTFNIDYIYFDNMLLTFIVPVELTSFAASTDNRNVTLNWSTATELNNSGFQIERSINGVDFQNIGFVAGHGTTTDIQNYSYVDQNVAAGTYSYRLKQVDLDGSFEYSKVAEVEVLGIREFALGQNYPNPFNPSTKISFSLAVDSKVSLKVFDVLGQEVAVLLNGQLSAGSQEVNFNAGSLNSGVYFYRIEADGIDGQKFSSVKKMILTK